MKGQVGFALAALACLLVARPVARRLRVPAPVLLVLVGLAYGELPGPNIVLRPDLVLFLVLPPLLYSSALQASLVDLRANLRAVVSLSVGLPLATAFAVAGLLVWVVPGLPFALAVALGAAVGPSDPVAALGIGRRSGMPGPLLTLVEGEGLLNDAVSLTLFQVALAAQLGNGFSAPSGIATFLLEALGGSLIGFVIAQLVRVLLRWVSDPLVENGLALGVPFAAYVAAVAAHSSGVLAVVIAGLLLGHVSSTRTEGLTRLQARAVWRLLDFLLEGFVFLLIGQQLPSVLDGLSPYRDTMLAAAAGLTVAAVLVVRVVWLGGMAALPRRVHGGRRALHPREVLALSWCGMRGVITLAAVFGLPLSSHGTALPDRDVLQLCAYSVVLVTLVVQGVTFAPVMSLVRLPDDATEERRMRAQARVAAARAGEARVEEVLAEGDVAEAVAARLRSTIATTIERHQQVLSHLDRGAVETVDTIVGDVAMLRRVFIDAEREELVRWRDLGRLSDRSLRELERELDVEASRSP